MRAFTANARNFVASKNTANPLLLNYKHEYK